MPQLEELIAPIVEGEGYELVEIVATGVGSSSVLRVFVHKRGGIGIDELARLSRKISAELDRVDIIPHRYFLEVSSPGLDRPLKTLRDFLRAISERIRVTKTDGATVEGLLEAADTNGITITTNEGSIVIPLDQISVAKIVY